MIKSVEKALKILNYVAGHKGVPVTLTDISTAMGIHIATCSHLIETLCSMQYLEKSARNSGVVIGPAAHSLSTPYVDRQDLLHIAVPHMKDLCISIQENVVISTYSNGTMYVPYSIYYRNGRTVGKTTVKGKLLDSATGLLILAYLNPLDRASTINLLPAEDETRQQYIRQQETYEAAFQRICREGVHLVTNETLQFGALACPIFGKVGLVAALGVNMPLERFSGEHLKDTIWQTKKTAAKISQIMMNDI